MKRFFAICGMTAFIELICLSYAVRLLPLWLVAVAVASAGCVVLAGGLVCMRKHLAVWRTLCAVGASVLIFGASFCYAQSRYDKCTDFLCGQTKEITVVLQDDGNRTSTGLLVYEAKSYDGAFDGTIRLFSMDGLAANAFDVVSLQGVFYEKSDDYYAYGHSRFYVASGYAERLTVVGHKSGVGETLFNLRKTISSILNRTVGYRSDIVKALLLGDKSGLTDEAEENIRGAGLSHVVAVSGFHVYMLMALIMAVLSVIKNKWVRFAACVVLTTGFAALCGFVPSVLRAVLMVWAAFGLRNDNRLSDGQNTLGLAVTVLLLVNPMLCYHMGFLLSAEATFGVVALFPALKRRFRTFLLEKIGVMPNGFASFLLDVLGVSTACVLCTLPHIMTEFGHVTWTGLIAYIAALPVIYVVFFCGVFAVLFGLMPGCEAAAGAVGQIASKGADVFMDITALFNVDFGQIDSTYLLICLAAGLICLILMNVGRKEKRKKLRLVVPVLVTLVLLCFSAAIDSFFVAPVSGDDICVAYVDVGQGMGSVVYEDGTAVVIDCGGNANPGESMTEYLEKNGVTEIEFVIFSHLHDDHTNGFADLCEAYEIDEVIIPWTKGDDDVYNELIQTAETEHAKVTVIEGDTTYTVGDTTLQLLTKHFKETTSDPNENSIIVRAVVGDVKFLFTGDITSTAEKRLLASYAVTALRADVLGVPHHGSKYSSSEDFVSAVSPRYAVFSVGKNNYGHPNTGVVELLKQYAVVYRTDEAGAVTFITDGTKLEVKTEK